MAGVVMVPSLRVPALQSAACGGQITKPEPPRRVGLRVSKYRREASRGRCPAVPTSTRCRPAVMAIAEPNAGKGNFTAAAAEQQNATAAAVGLKQATTTTPAAYAAASDLLSGADTAETSRRSLSTVWKSTNIRWHECPVGKLERQKLLGQKGCVVWITGLSGSGLCSSINLSGKSTMACALSRELHGRGHLSYLLDGDNVRHGLSKNLSFNPQDREENIRRVGEVAKLFADSGVICIASLISPYRRDRDACRALLPNRMFIEVFMDMPLKVCEARDPKGLYKLARAGKIKGFTGIDDPYEPPLNCEIVIQQRNGVCPSPEIMAEQVMAYLELNGFLQA